MGEDGTGRNKDGDQGWPPIVGGGGGGGEGGDGGEISCSSSSSFSSFVVATGDTVERGWSLSPVEVSGTGGIVHGELSSLNGEDFFFPLLLIVEAAEAQGMEMGGVGRTVAVIEGARIAVADVRGVVNAVDWEGLRGATAVNLIDGFIERH